MDFPTKKKKFNQATFNRKTHKLSHHTEIYTVHHVCKITRFDVKYGLKLAKLLV